MSAYNLELDGSRESGPCECCGHTTRTVWGFVRRGGDAHAIYYVRWAVGGVGKHGAMFDIILGEFGDGSEATDRYAVTLEYRLTYPGPGFMVVDATKSPVAENSLVGKALS